MGGLVGCGRSARIVASSVVAGTVSGSDWVGGLVGWGESARIVSSSVVEGDVSGSGTRVGGLAGSFSSGFVAYSYVVSGDTMAGMLVGTGNGAKAASYWDSGTSGIDNGNHGEAKTGSELQSPEIYTGIYETWDDGADIDDMAGIDDITIYCDKNNSESIESNEQDSDNRIWDFGTSSQYPAIRCTPVPPAEWRSWWSLVNDEPQLNQTRLDSLLP